MNFSSVVEKVESSQTFKNFKKENKDAELCAGFFVIDYEQDRKEQQLDYCLKNGKIYTFTINKEITLEEAETIEGKKEKLPKITKEIKIDISDLEKIVQDKIKKKILKIIAIIQKYKDKQIWNLTVMTESFEIDKIHIDTQTGEILKFEKRNLFDFVKKVK